jgi:CubicO group peptidase (beta-lactamase class C family)
MSQETLPGPQPGGGATGVLQAVVSQFRDQVAAYCESTNVPGYVAGVYHDGAQTVVAHGLANVVTGAPMREDTGFLFGSITKVLTATLVLQQVERGIIDLAERVTAYLPDFHLTTPGAAEKICVRHLLTHTNGIDADLFFPDAQGPGFSSMRARISPTWAPTARSNSASTFARRTVKSHATKPYVGSNDSHHVSSAVPPITGRSPQCITSEVGSCRSRSAHWGRQGSRAG